MSQNDAPRIARRRPYRLELPPGDYLRCACKHSRDPPYCDGRHNRLPAAAAD